MTLDKADCVQIMEMYQEIKLLCLLLDMGVIDEEEYRGVLQIGDRQGITFKRLNERYADTGQIGFIATKRLDGKLILPEAVKVLQQKGTASSGS